MQHVAVIGNLIATEINAQLEQVQAAIRLIDSGATIPFIARYRKEMTGGLDDTQLRLLNDRLSYLREVETRRASILKSIRDQQKLTDELEAAINTVTTKAELEDLYLPYRPRRQTRAHKARERGLGFLAEAILNDRLYPPEEMAVAYINDDVPSIDAALEGARDIIAETMAENAELISRLRQLMHRYAYVRARPRKGHEQHKDNSKFSDYFDYYEKWAKIPSHRALAFMRGRNEDILSLSMELESDEALQRVYDTIDEVYYISDKMPGDLFLAGVARWAWEVKLSLHLEVDLMGDLRERADKDAIQVFAHNLKDILLAPPAGPRPTLGLDPGFRHGIKIAAIDGTGKLLQTDTVFPFEPRFEVLHAKEIIKKLIIRHKIELIAIGNGTASRDTERFVHNLLNDFPVENQPQAVVVSEAGASVYSASPEAAAEFPELDVTVRSAISIARRLQDPLAELVKLAPRSIGVGQYQHDVDQYQLSRALDGVVEDAVNAVGVDLNTASVELLTHISGLNRSIAQSVVDYRDKNGPFMNRNTLKKVSRLGERTFEQCAGFLRIYGGTEPLDATAVHPEAYALARRIVGQSGLDIYDLMGNRGVLRGLSKNDFVDERFGLPTVKDVFLELEKPGRDPRPVFKAAQFAEEIETIRDLKPGMILEGTVTNITAFGVFVNIGIHEDGLVHISELSNQYVQDPHDFVKTGDVITVRVKGVDIERQRIALSMRQHSDDDIRAASATPFVPASTEMVAKPPLPQHNEDDIVAELAAFDEELLDDDLPLGDDFMADGMAQQSADDSHAQTADENDGEDSSNESDTELFDDAIYEEALSELSDMLDDVFAEDEEQAKPDQK